MNPPRILLVNPNTNAATTALMEQAARAALPPTVELTSATAPWGVQMIVDEDDLRLAALAVARWVPPLAASVDAVVIAAFGSPGLEELRARIDIPVFGIGHAALREAGRQGRRFGIATTTPRLQEAIARQVLVLDLQHQFTGTRIARGGPLTLADNPDVQTQELQQAVQACIELDGAESVIIGGGPLTGSAEVLSQRLGLPVLSPVVCAMHEVCATLGLKASAATA